MVSQLQFRDYVTLYLEHICSLTFYKALPPPDGMVDLLGRVLCLHTSLDNSLLNKYGLDHVTRTMERKDHEQPGEIKKYKKHDLKTSMSA